MAAAVVRRPPAGAGADHRRSAAARRDRLGGEGERRSSEPLLQQARHEQGRGHGAVVRRPAGARRLARPARHDDGRHEQRSVPAGGEVAGAVAERREQGESTRLHGRSPTSSVVRRRRLSECGGRLRAHHEGARLQGESQRRAWRHLSATGRRLVRRGGRGVAGLSAEGQRRRREVVRRRRLPPVQGAGLDVEKKGMR